MNEQRPDTLQRRLDRLERAVWRLALAITRPVE